MKWRGKLINKLHREKKKNNLKDEVKAAEDGGNDTDSELEEEIRKAQTRELKELRKEKEKKLK